MTILQIILIAFWSILELVWTFYVIRAWLNSNFNDTFIEGATTNFAWLVVHIIAMGILTIEAFY